MKKIWLCILFALSVGTLCACSRGDNFIEETDPTVYEETTHGGEGVAGKTYVFEHDGFGGEFTLSLRADGSMGYYEGWASSHIGDGTWTQEGDMLTISEPNGRGGQRVNRFRVTQNALIFVAEGSDNFIYVQMNDGDRFRFDWSHK